MAEFVKAEVELKKGVPAKCAECRYLDTENDPLSGTTRLYCRAPWWQTKRWFCALPTGVARA